MSEILSVMQQIISQGGPNSDNNKSAGRNWRKVGQQARNLRSEETFFPVPVRIQMSQVSPITALEETIDLEIAILCLIFLCLISKRGELFTEQASLTTSIAYFYLLLSKSHYTFCRNCMDKLLTSFYSHSTVKEFQEQVHVTICSFSHHVIFQTTKKAKKRNGSIMVKPKTAQGAGVYCSYDDSYSKL